MVIVALDREEISGVWWWCMLVRTNIYLDEEVRGFFKRRAKAERVTMAEKIRRVLGQVMHGQGESGAASLLTFARKGWKSGLGDLASRHDEYLLGKK